jgi:hypothetical protein
LQEAALDIHLHGVELESVELLFESLGLAVVGASALLHCHLLHLVEACHGAVELCQRPVVREAGVVKSERETSGGICPF